MASKWDTFPRAALDFEATGTNPHEDRVVSAAWIDFPGTGRPTVRTWLADPGVEIPDEAAAIHGITTERARAEGMDPGQLLYEVTGLIAVALGRRLPVVIYNAPYDLTLLESENRRHSIPTLAERLGPGKTSPILDPLVLAKHGNKFRIRSVKDEQGDPIRLEDGSTKKYCHGCDCGATSWNLESTCLHYGVRLFGAHDAAADAVAAGRLFPKIMAKHPGSFRGQTLMGLHHSQVGWRKEQADGLRQFFNKVGVDDHDECPDPHDHQCCDPSWPLLKQPRPPVAPPIEQAS